MTTTVKERPIIFSAESLRAIQERRKTMTRRVVKPQPISDRVGMVNAAYCGRPELWLVNGAVSEYTCHGKTPPEWQCPYGDVGDRIWVQEKFAETDDEYGAPIIVYAAGGSKIVGRDDTGNDFLIDGDHGKFVVGEWKSPRSMPRWACRLELETTEVKVERLQDISHRDAVTEGWPGYKLPDCCPGDPKCVYNGMDARTYIEAVGDGDDACIEWYANLWDRLNKKHPWSSNPWVWCVSFRVAEDE